MKLFTKTGSRPDLAHGLYFAKLWPRKKKILTILGLELLQERRKKTNIYQMLTCVGLTLKISHRGGHWYFHFYCAFSESSTQYFYSSSLGSNQLHCVISQYLKKFPSATGYFSKACAWELIIIPFVSLKQSPPSLKEASFFPSDSWVPSV